MFFWFIPQSPDLTKREDQLLKWSHICLSIVPLSSGSYKLTRPPLPGGSLSLRGGILGVRFASRDHSNGRSSSRPGYLYPNMRQRIKSNFCYYFLQHSKHDELATVQSFLIPLTSNREQSGTHGRDSKVIYRSLSLGSRTGHTDDYTGYMPHHRYLIQFMETKVKQRLMIRANYKPISAFVGWEHLL